LRRAFGGGREVSWCLLSHDCEWRGFGGAAATRVGDGVFKKVLIAPLGVGLSLLVERDLVGVGTVGDVLVEVHANLSLD
jgi:hypothetical protein